MTDEEKVTNGRNSRGSQQLPNDLAATEVNIPELSESIITTAEEKLQDVTGNLIPSPEIEPSIYQTGVVTGSTTTANPATTKSGAATATAETTLAGKYVTTSTPEGTAAETDATAASPTPEPGQATTDEVPAETEPTVADQTATPSETPADPEATKTEPSGGPKPEETEGSPKPEGASDETVTPTAETDAAKADVEGKEKEITKSPSEGELTRTTSTTQPTTEPPPRDPYQIDIPIEKKINKRTQRKLWEEIEKRKPLIPKYVERHIQKYAKPPFELWGCKSRGKGSCYGCG